MRDIKGRCDWRAEMTWRGTKTISSEKKMPFSRWNIDNVTKIDAHNKERDAVAQGDASQGPKIKTIGCHAVVFNFARVIKKGPCVSPLRCDERAAISVALCSGQDVEFKLSGTSDWLTSVNANQTLLCTWFWRFLLSGSLLKSHAKQALSMIAQFSRSLKSIKSIKEVAIALPDWLGKQV